jgi:hypothetical protein
MDSPRCRPRLDPLAATWLGEGAVAQRVARWWRTEVERTTDRAWAERFARLCPVPGVTPGHYLQAVLVGPEGEALAGIRFLGGDVTRPFVDLLAYDGPVAPWVERALQRFDVFGPQRVRVRCGIEAPLPGATVDQWVVAGWPVALHQPERLAPATPEQAVPFAVSAHRGWEEAVPWMKGRVVPLDEAGARGAAMEQALWWILDQGDRVGVLAVRWAAEREWAGWCVVEQVLLGSHAGKGLAASAQRAAAARLPTQLWFGTIDAANEASLRTAEAVGRQRVGAWWWVQR